MTEEASFTHTQEPTVGVWTPTCVLIGCLWACEPVYNKNLHLYNLHPLIISRSKWSKETGSVLNMHARHTHINSHTYCFEALHLTQVPLTSLLGHQWSELSGPASKTAEEISTQSALIHRQSQNSNTTSWSICSSRMSQGKEFIQRLSINQTAKKRLPCVSLARAYEPCPTLRWVENP